MVALYREFSSNGVVELDVPKNMSKTAWTAAVAQNPVLLEEFAEKVDPDLTFEKVGAERLTCNQFFILMRLKRAQMDALYKVGENLSDNRADISWDIIEASVSDSTVTNSRYFQSSTLPERINPRSALRSIDKEMLPFPSLQKNSLSSGTFAKVY